MEDNNENKDIPDSKITEEAKKLWKMLPDMILEKEYEKEIKDKFDKKILFLNRKAKARAAKAK